ncbi:hypothetical protein GTY86_35545 [Streptomyces sp. SID5770]|uniref:hypothetical protein n=1 Tax=Streptomyces sp. SID5770 TaxID=2690308 RepID=UPI0013698E5A|nr:hypothetical protein [Streptomyces sp. SID5770]MZE53820.1 hypothetical protein [Streptomyces sp. SID5770]MZE56491.1 hypothetical protein [Streptomyces sp. SID5770]
MDDTKTIAEPTYKVTIAGAEYEFDQPDAKLIERMILISHMNADTFVTLEACTKWFSVAAGPETWATIMRRFLADEITVQDLLTAINDLTGAIAVSKELAADA